jgi:hypothetical protein
MRRWLLKQWHRFTLGKTARHILPSRWSPGPGSAVHLAHIIKMAAHDGLPLGIYCEVVTRKATDVDRGTVRIVLETCE